MPHLGAKKTEASLRNTLSPFLREETMQDIFKGILPEKSDTGRTVTVVERLANYLASSSIVLFMKGSPDFPQCGFSAQVANALRRCQAGFTHVDVLQDPELRQTLKTYSNWPTIPQLYFEGELVGGCDIVMDMYRSGDLLQMVRQITAVPAE
jgi:monothiol glutaredoxin